MKLRFAPSPTGRLHVGNIRVALLNWLFARRAGGCVLLRLDDTDRERSSEVFARGIQEDLSWLDLDWDEFARQSERLGIYAAAADRLAAAGRLYPCYETAEELALKRKSRLQQGRPPLYDRAALGLTPAERRAFEAAGRRPHWRFRLFHRPIQWDDLSRGAQHFEGADLSDPVLLREDGRPLYTLSSVVDDLALGVSHVIRGEDHVSNTAVQIQIAEALGGPVPAYGHVPLLAGAEGESLSKRLGSLSIEALREEGLEPIAILQLLAHLGTPDPAEPTASLADLAAAFDLARFGRATPKFDPAELRQLNARVLHAMDWERAAPRIEALGLNGVAPDLWEAVHGNLERLADLAEWRRVCEGPVQPVIEDEAFAGQAAEALPPEPWDETTWPAFTGALKAASGRKGRALFHPLRLALTGREHGPEMRNLLPLIGRKRALARLSGETA